MIVYIVVVSSKNKIAKNIMSFNQAAKILAAMQEDSMSTDNRYNATTGSVDVHQHLQNMMDDQDDNVYFNSMINDDDYHAEDPPNDGPKEKKTRQKRIILARRSEDGQLEAIPPTESLWWHMYIDCPQPNDSRFLIKFRRRFRLPYKQFLLFVDEAKEAKWFPRWTGKDAKGKPSSPLELLILGAFRYLGRGLTFDDLEESTAISEEVHRNFFHQFIMIGSTVLYEKYVKAPQTKEEVEQHMHEFAQAGLPGAFASTDATNIIHELCSWRNRRAHIGFKSKAACRTYNTTVNHRRRILASTFGNPGSFNDKTLILFDTFIRDIKRGEKLDDYTFELLERRGEEVVVVLYKGVWIVVDNGYHSWSTTVPPMSNCYKPEEIRWSAWMESMRKDVGTFIPFYTLQYLMHYIVCSLGFHL